MINSPRYLTRSHSTLKELDSRDVTYGSKCEMSAVNIQRPL
jgi:hypothetical protein